MKARKALAKQTQGISFIHYLSISTKRKHIDFRKTSDEEKLNNLGALLKLYQEEIDRLTRRSKAAESSFLTIYKCINEAPDPTPFLELTLVQSQQLQKLAETEQENKKLQIEQAEFVKEYQGIKNQEVTIRK